MYHTHFFNRKESLSVVFISFTPYILPVFYKVENVGFFIFTFTLF